MIERVLGLMLGIHLLIEVGFLIWGAVDAIWPFDSEKWREPLQEGEKLFRLSMFTGILLLALGIETASVAFIAVGSSFGIVMFSLVGRLVAGAFTDDEPAKEIAANGGWRVNLGFLIYGLIYLGVSGWGFVQYGKLNLLVQASFIVTLFILMVLFARKDLRDRRRAKSEAVSDLDSRITPMISGKGA